MALFDFRSIENSRYVLTSYLLRKSQVLVGFWGAKPVFKRIIESGKIITAAGVFAGIDMALTLAAKVYSSQVAQTLQLGIEYDPEPPFDVGSPEKAKPGIRNALLTRMEGLFEKHGN